MDILDIVTLISYVALSVDVLFQIRQLRLTHSSHDISLIGVTIRYIAILIIFYKFLTLAEWSLLLGQGLLAIFFSLYLLLAFYYHRHKLPGIKR